MKNTSKGFTLIELLAVIVILAVIALIATPMILNVISTARKGSAESSALGYVDAIEKQISINMIKGENQINDGVYDYNEIAIDINGASPTAGWYEVEKSRVKDYSFVIDGFVVTKGEKTTEGTTSKDKPEGGSVAVKAYALGELVYFDPASTTKCDENSTSATCYKWRVIETNDSSSKATITLQMDYNLINLSAWSPATNTMGPVTALTALNNQTSAWTRVEPLTYEYDITMSGTNTGSNYGTMSCTNGTCTFAGTTLQNVRARMITGEEVRDITNTKVTNLSALSKNWTVGSSYDDYFYFSRTNITLGTKASGTGDIELAWLVENTRVNANSGATSNGTDNYGYWTLSPVSDRANFAWNVDFNGYLSNFNYVSNGLNYGVRPVITVSKSNI